ncbi:MAG: ARMT1-like domain-containing protein, partial [Elusimicrobiota bacterium]|nr:ARMT1-like domain-containing protein [Elusimicrobiota bacterium]
MKTYLECIPCFFKQALHAAKLAGANQKTQKEILMRLSKEVPKFSLKSSPPEMGRTIYSLVNKYSPKKDPYEKIKTRSNE